MSMPGSTPVPCSVLRTKVNHTAVRWPRPAGGEQGAGPGSPEFVIHSIDFEAKKPAPEGPDGPQDSDCSTASPSASEADGTQAAPVLGPALVSRAAGLSTPPSTGVASASAFDE